AAVKLVRVGVADVGGPFRRRLVARHAYRLADPARPIPPLDRLARRRKRWRAIRTRIIPARRLMKHPRSRIAVKRFACRSGAHKNREKKESDGGEKPASAHGRFGGTGESGCRVKVRSLSGSRRGENRIRHRRSAPLI